MLLESSKSILDHMSDDVSLGHPHNRANSIHINISPLMLVFVSQSVIVKQAVQMHPQFPSLETNGPRMNSQKHEEYELHPQSISYEDMTKNQIRFIVYNRYVLLISTTKHTFIIIIININITNTGWYLKEANQVISPVWQSVST